MKRKANLERRIRKNNYSFEIQAEKTGVEYF